MLPRRVVARLVYLLPTLFGVTLLAFALLELVPGDPLSEASLRSRSGLSATAREELRRARGEHLPLFFNSRPFDRTQLLRLILAGRGSAYLERLNTRLLPQLCFLVRLEIAAPQSLDAARKILARRGLVVHDDELSDWQRLEARLFATTRIAMAIERLKDPQRATGALAELLRIGALANRQLVAALTRAPTPELARALAELNHRPYRFVEGDSRARVHWAVRRWQRFVATEEAMLAARGPLEQVLRGFSETRYGRWLAGLLRLDLGESPSERVAVTTLLRRHLPTTLLLGGLALLFAYLLGIPLGTLQARYRDRVGGTVIAAFLVLLFALPSYWAATVALQSFSGSLGWFPSGGLPRPAPTAGLLERLALWVQHLALPVAILTYGLLVVISRYWAAALGEELDSPYVATARAKGCSPRRALIRHAARNALGTSISLFGLLIPTLLGGAVIVERLFDLPGMGWLTVRAIENRDFPTVLAVVVLSGAVTILALALADWLQLLADPRQRREEAR